MIRHYYAACRVVCIASYTRDYTPHCKGISLVYHPFPERTNWAVQKNGLGISLQATGLGVPIASGCNVFIPLRPLNARHSGTSGASPGSCVLASGQEKGLSLHR